MRRPRIGDLLMPEHQPGQRHPAVPPAAGPTRTRVRLPQRQSQILQMMANGESTEEIAESLDISPETVRTHLKRGVDKLGARNRSHAIALALRAGLIA